MTMRVSSYAGGDAELAEGLAEVVGDGVGADVHAGGDLAVVQSLGDQAGHGLLGAGQAVPPGDGPGGGVAPVASADAELAQPPPDAGLVTVGADLAVFAKCVFQVTDGLIPVALPSVQDAEVFGGGGPGPGIGVLRGGLGQAGRVAAGEAPAVGRGGGQGREPGVVVGQGLGGAGGAGGQLTVARGQGGASQPGGQGGVAEQEPGPGLRGRRTAGGDGRGRRPGRRAPR